MLPINPSDTVASLNNDTGGQPEQSYIDCIADTGVYEIFTVLPAAFASTAQGDYLAFTEPVTGKKFAAWYDKDADGTAPSGAVYTAADYKIKVSIATGNSVTQIAQALKTAITSDGHLSNMAMSGAGTTITFTANKHGTLTDAAAHNTGDTGAGSLTVTVTQQGVASNLNSKYFTLHDGGTDDAFYVWLNVNSQGSDPAPGGTGIAATVATGATASAVATAVSAAIDANANFESTADSSRVKATNSANGEATNIGAGNSGFTVSVRSEGRAQKDPAPSTSTSSLTNF